MSTVSRRVLLGLIVAVLVAALIVAAGFVRLKRRIAAGAALNAPPAAIASTRPVRPFTGSIDLIRGGTLTIAGIGINDATRPTWWSPDGANIAAPAQTQTHHELPLGIGGSSARQVAWRRAEHSSADGNVEVSFSAIAPLASLSVNDGVTFGTGEYDDQFVTLSRYLFAPGGHASTFDLRIAVDDHRWQTFAVFTPGGTTKVGPISAEFSASPRGLAQVKLTGDWAWPMRLVAVTADGFSVTGFDYGSAAATPMGRIEERTLQIVPLANLKALHVQFCGIQRFEIRDLPLDPLPTTRPASVVEESLTPSVPGLPPLNVVLPPEMPAKQQLDLMRRFQAAATQPAQP